MWQRPAQICRIPDADMCSILFGVVGVLCGLSDAAVIFPIGLGSAVSRRICFVIVWVSAGQFGNRFFHDSAEFCIAD